MRPRRGVARLFDRLFPPTCVVCGAAAGSSAPVCSLCWHRLPRMAPPRCPRCGATRLLDLPGPGRCLACDRWPEGLARAAAPYRMEAGASRLVHALKYEGARALAAPMARSMEAGARRVAGGERAVLVPVPLAPARRRERGFNQARELARELAARTGWEVRAPLSRAPGGRRQATLGRTGRRRNVRGRFRPARRRADAAPGAFVLVDDVLTTGATAAACSRALAALGGEVRGVVVFARALQRLEAG